MSAVHVRALVAGEQYALAVEHVAEVLRLNEVTPVPGAPPALLGLLNLRGEAVSVVDVASALGLQGERRPAHVVVVVVSDDGRRAGLAIDAVLDVATLPPTSPEDGLSCVRETTVIDGALIGVLDVGALLDRAAGGPS
jgi:purine-binding chemotaxis protein CheW